MWFLFPYTLKATAALWNSENLLVEDNAPVSVLLGNSHKIFFICKICIFSHRFYILPTTRVKSIMKCAWVWSPKTSCHFQFEFISLCCAGFAEIIFPINTAALSEFTCMIKYKCKNKNQTKPTTKKIHYRKNKTKQNKEKNPTNSTFLSGFFCFNNNFHKQRRELIFYGPLCIGAATVAGLSST